MPLTIGAVTLLGAMVDGGPASLTEGPPNFPRSGMEITNTGV